MENCHWLQNWATLASIWNYDNENLKEIVSYEVQEHSDDGQILTGLEANVDALQLVPTTLDECNDYMDQNPQTLQPAQIRWYAQNREGVSTNSGVSEPEIHLQSSVAKSIAWILGASPTSAAKGRWTDVPNSQWSNRNA